MNFPSVSQFSIAKGTGGINPPEMYIPLWWYSGGNLNSNQTTAGSYLLGKDGSVAAGGASVASSAKLHTLNVSWNPNAQYAFESAIENQSGTNNGTTLYAELWDITSNKSVTGSQISTTSGSFTVLRSGQFTLTPGHVYGVTWWTSNASYQCAIIDASLIVFPS